MWKYVVAAAALAYVTINWSLRVAGTPLDDVPSVTECMLPTKICANAYEAVWVDGELKSLEFEVRGGHVLVLYQQYGTAEAVLDDERGDAAKARLRSFLQAEHLPDAMARRYEIWGTADLVEVKSVQDEEGVCSGRKQSSLRAAGLIPGKWPEA